MRRPVVFAVALFTLSAGTANATIIGSAVNVSGTTIDGGTAANPIDFYIPLSKDASGNYGTGTIGRTADTCTAPSATDPCGGDSPSCGGICWRDSGRAKADGQRWRERGA